VFTLSKNKLKLF